MRSKTIRLTPLLFAGLVSACVLAFLVLIRRPEGRTTENIQADQAVKQLWSADAAEREVAKATLFQLGRKAVPALTEVLRDIVEDPTPRFVQGHEQEAAEIEVRYRSLAKAGRDEESREALRELLNLSVNWRLKRDVCELLGRLNAEEGIPVLIEAMEREDSGSAWETISPAMQALIDIGRPAVPMLIDAIETAEAKAERREFSTDVGLDYEAKKRISKIEIFQIQARASIVLGQIGDDRALPVLEKLLSTTNDSFLAPYASEAIAKIREKSSQHG